MTRVGFILATLVALLGAVFAGQTEDEGFEDERQYRERMHDIDHAFSELAKSHNVRRGEDVAEEAARLATLFERVEEFWKGRGDEESAGFARTAREGAEAAEEAAIKREQRALDAAIETIASSCEGCHQEPLDKHRLPKN